MSAMRTQKLEHPTAKQPKLRRTFNDPFMRAVKNQVFPQWLSFIIHNLKDCAGCRPDTGLKTLEY